jgi:hypothetical protein
MPTQLNRWAYQPPGTCGTAVQCQVQEWQYSLAVLQLFFWQIGVVNEFGKTTCSTAYGGAKFRECSHRGVRHFFWVELGVKQG